MQEAMSMASTVEEWIAWRNGYSLFASEVAQGNRI
jgi:hypothetical protein